MKIKNSKGFTLIELLIVVAIIAILAAIAIPQFSAYRIRGFNAAANADVRNAATTEEALFADSQAYGQIAMNTLQTIATCNANKSGAYGPSNPATASASGSFMQNVNGSVGFSLSNHVVIATAVPAGCASYIIVSKNSLGDKCYGRDSDSTASYQANSATTYLNDPLGANNVTTLTGNMPADASDGSAADLQGFNTVGQCAAFSTL